MSASNKLKEILSIALSGDLTPMMRGIGISQRGKVEMFSRLAYIAGIKRAIEIVEEYEKEQQDGSRKS